MTELEAFRRLIDCVLREIDLACLTVRQRDSDDENQEREACSAHERSFLSFIERKPQAADVSETRLPDSR